MVIKQNYPNTSNLAVALSTHQLTKKYKNRNVVDHVNLSLLRGEVYGFLGPNGAGKTTTIGMILGLINPTSGKVNILNQSILILNGYRFWLIGWSFRTRL